MDFSGDISYEYEVQYDTACEVEDTTFHACTLTLNAPVTFVRCNFLELRCLVIDFDSEEMYTPFDKETKVAHPLNYVLEGNVNCTFPNNFRSIRVANAIKLVFNNNGILADKNAVIYNPMNIEVQIRHGEDDDGALEEFREAFSSDEVYFKSHKQLGNGNYIRTVALDDADIGTIYFVNIDSSFSKAVLDCETPDLNFFGEIPDNWCKLATEETLKKFSKICKLRVKKIGVQAFRNMNVYLDKLEVLEDIGSKAFSHCTGKIGECVVLEVLSDSFKNTHIRIGHLHVSVLHEDAEIEAHSISIPDAKMSKGIIKTHLLIIRDKFEEPIEVNADKVDFSSVTSNGYFQVTFPDEVQSAIKPGIINHLIRESITVQGSEDPEEVVLRKMGKKYDRDSLQTYWRDDTIEVSFKERIVGRYHITVDNTKRLILQAAIVLLLIDLIITPYICS